MTELRKNDFVSKSAEDFLLTDSDTVYEYKIKNMTDKTVAKFHSGHAQFLELVNKYGLKPRWQRWEVQKDLNGKEIGRGKYVDAK